MACRFHKTHFILISCHADLLNIERTFWAFRQKSYCASSLPLTHLPLVQHICINESDQHLATSHYIWTNAGLLSIEPSCPSTCFSTNFSEILIKIQNFSFTKMHLKLLSLKWRPFCRGDMSSNENQHKFKYHINDIDNQRSFKVGDWKSERNRTAVISYQYFSMFST